MKQMMRRFMKDESGASLIEYVLIAGLISIVGIITMQLIGADVGAIWTKIELATASAK